MIKGRLELDGDRPGLLIGLSSGNMKLLLDGKPIAFDTEQLGLPAMTVVIAGGATEPDILAELRGTHLPVHLVPERQ